jgi:hypothetical protein
LWYLRLIMNFDERVRAVRENDAREKREGEESAQRRHEARTALRATWEKVTRAIVQSGIQPDVRVATPEGIARADEVNKNRPRSYYDKPFLPSLLEGLFPNAQIRPTYIRHQVPKEVDEEWDRAVFDAIGSLVQPAWDMESYIDSPGGTSKKDGKVYVSDRLFLAQDATIYTGLVGPVAYRRISPAGVVYPGSFNTLYPISACMELNDEKHDDIELALATLVARRELRGIKGSR